MPQPADPERRSLVSFLLQSQMLLICPLLLFGALVSLSNAQPPDPARGQLLYENHCRFCHTAKVHERPSKPRLTRAQLRSIVNEWQRQEGLSWTPQDTADVVDYLVRTRYQRLQKQ
ncbi:MAG TPA: cytochrome c [Burkholderiales bacterium]|nr:cytochrome c [Burkholderiales bacterium]